MLKPGLLLLDPGSAEAVQGSLVLRPYYPSRAALILAIDALNYRYGRDRVRYAASGPKWAWKLRAEHYSTCSTA